MPELLTKEERDKAQSELGYGITALRVAYFTLVLRRYEATVAALEAERKRRLPMIEAAERWYKTRTAIFARTTAVTLDDAVAILETEGALETIVAAALKEGSDA